MINQTISSNEIIELENQPCEFEQYTQFHLWSIAEIMEKFSVALLSNALSNLPRIMASIDIDDLVNNSFDCEKALNQFREGFIESLRDIKLSRVLRGQISRIEKRLEDSNCSVIEIHTMFRELQNNILHELTLSRFLRIQEERKCYYEPPSSLFGQDVANIFPDASRDIDAAGRCFALDEWTACVFHLMRVLEIGLHKFAKTMGLDEKSLELENWKILIDQIEKKIRLLEQEPKSGTKAGRLQLYSEAAIGFRYFKDAWRNHVSHSRANYDERETIIIFNNVQAFMQILTKNNKATGDDKL